MHRSLVISQIRENVILARFDSQLDVLDGEDPDALLQQSTDSQVESDLPALQRQLKRAVFINSIVLAIGFAGCTVAILLRSRTIDNKTDEEWDEEW